MQVSKWGNSLAIRLPAAVVGALALKAGDEVEVRVAADNAFEISPKPTNAEVLARLRQYRGTLPADFKFDRLEAYERPQGLAAPSPAPAGVKQSGQATFA